MGATIAQFERHEGLSRRNLDMLGRVRNSDGVEPTMIFSAKTLKEVGRGWATQPMPVTSDAIKSVPFRPYFLSGRNMEALGAKYA